MLKYILANTTWNGESTRVLALWRSILLNDGRNIVAYAHLFTALMLPLVGAIFLEKFGIFGYLFDSIQQWNVHFYSPKNFQHIFLLFTLLLAAGLMYQFSIWEGKRDGIF